MDVHWLLEAVTCFYVVQGFADSDGLLLVLPGLALRLSLLLNPFAQQSVVLLLLLHALHLKLLHFTLDLLAHT